MLIIAPTYFRHLHRKSGSSTRFSDFAYDLLDDGMGFSLVPWKPVNEKKLGQQIVAAVASHGRLENKEA